MSYKIIKYRVTQLTPEIMKGIDLLYQHKYKLYPYDLDLVKTHQLRAENGKIERYRLFYEPKGNSGLFVYDFYDEGEIDWTGYKSYIYYSNIRGKIRNSLREVFDEINDNYVISN